MVKIPYNVLTINELPPPICAVVGVKMPIFKKKVIFFCVIRKKVVTLQPDYYAVEYRCVKSDIF